MTSFRPQRRRFAAISVLTAGLASFSPAQTNAPPTFEVASIHPTDPNTRGGSFRLAPGGGLQISGASLRMLITFAYDAREFQVTGGPSWINTDRYDITAKPSITSEVETDPRKMTIEQGRALQEGIRLRMQSLLAERFQLVIRKETKEMPAYALVIGKNGHKLQESKAENAQMGMRVGRGTIDAKAMAMDGLVRSLGQSAGRPVVDQTGLTGRYDFKLEWTPEMGGPGPFGGPGGPEPPPAADPSGPSLFTAIQEQLGLRLESTKAPVETYIIEKAEKPTAN